MRNYSTQYGNAVVQSAYADHPVGVSSKYSFIPTTVVLDQLKSRGWEPTQSSETRVVKVENQGFQKHMIRLRNMDEYGKMAGVGDTYPEVLLINSHMGSAAFKFMVGMFRVICGNGLIVADSMLGSIVVRHVGFDSAQVFSAIDSIMDGIPRVQSRISEFQEIILTPNEQGIYAEAAAQLRWDDTSKVDVARLVAFRRYADSEPTLWNTYNRVQENMVAGGRVLRGKNTWSRNKKAVAVTGIDQNVKLNKALWTLTEEMAKIKAS